jgi:hypothetical protein
LTRSEAFSLGLTTLTAFTRLEQTSLEDNGVGGDL